MSYEEQDDGEEYANGGAERFANLEPAFKKGGNPRLINDAIREAMSGHYKTIGTYFKQAKPFVATPNVVALAHEMSDVRHALDAAEALAKELRRRHDYLRLQLVPVACDNEGIESIKIEGVGRLVQQGDAYVGIIKGKVEAAFEWLRDSGREDMIKETVHNQTLKACLKEVMKKGAEELPDGVFKFEPFTRAVIQKVK